MKTLNTHIITTLVVILLAPFILMAQSDSTKTDKSSDKALSKAIRSGDVNTMIEGYKAKLKSDPDNADANYNLGAIYIESKRNLHEAETHLEKVLDQKKEGDYPEFFYYLARAYHYNHNYFFALAAYNSYLFSKEEGSIDKEFKKEIDYYISKAENGSDLIERDSSIFKRFVKLNSDRSLYFPEGIRYVDIQNLGPTINTMFSEYGPVVFTKDKMLVFTSRRKSKGGEVYFDGQHYENIYSATLVNDNWSVVTPVDSSKYFNGSVKNTEDHEATVSLSQDENSLIIFRENTILLTERDEDGKWSDLEKASKVVHQKLPFMNGATISSDGTLMIVSATNPEDPENEHLDLYMLKKDSTGEWAKYENMGAPVNTVYDETSPFILNDSTVFFSSNSIESIGEYDVFVTEFKDGAWTNPKNLGVPINSAYNEVNYSVGVDKSFAFLASDRPNGYGKYDIYRVSKGVDIQNKYAYKFQTDSMNDLLADMGNSGLNDMALNDDNSNSDIGLSTDPKTGDISYPVYDEAGNLIGSNTIKVKTLAYDAKGNPIVVKDGYYDGIVYDKNGNPLNSGGGWFAGYVYDKDTNMLNPNGDPRMGTVYDKEGNPINPNNGLYEGVVYDENKKALNPNGGFYSGVVFSKNPVSYDKNGFPIGYNSLMAFEPVYDKQGEPIVPVDGKYMGKVYDKNGNALNPNGGWYAGYVYDKDSNLLNPEGKPFIGAVYDKDGNEINPNKGVYEGVVYNKNGKALNPDGGFYTGVVFDKEAPKVGSDGYPKGYDATPLFTKVYDKAGDPIVPIDGKYEGLVYDKNGLALNPNGGWYAGYVYDKDSNMLNPDKKPFIGSVFDKDGKEINPNNGVYEGVVYNKNGKALNPDGGYYTGVVFNKQNPNNLFAKGGPNSGKGSGNSGSGKGGNSNIDPYGEGVPLEAAKEARVYFDFDKSAIRSGDAKTLDGLVDFLKENPTLKVFIAGHTDSKGTEEYNLKLSMRRAESVQSYLVSKGVTNEYKLFGFGESRPFMVEKSDEDAASNRQVHIRIFK